MVTIAQKVEELVNQSPYLREGISNKIINLSALSRQLKPQVDKALAKDTTETAIFIALQRYGKKLKPYVAANPGHFLGNMSLRSDLCEITVLNSKSLMPSLSSLLQNFQQDRSMLFVFTQGIYETTIIASRSLVPQIKACLTNERIESQLDNLTAISLQRMHNHLDAIGVLMYPLRIIAWQGISVIEIVTTLNELMIIVEDKNVDRAVVAVRQALHSTNLLTQAYD